MTEPISQQKPDADRKPGRSFDDPSKPLGDGIIQRSARSETVPEDLRSREEQSATSHNGVAERAKVIAVLRKFEELIADENPPGPRGAEAPGLARPRVRPRRPDATRVRRAREGRRRA